VAFWENTAERRTSERVMDLRDRLQRDTGREEDRDGQDRQGTVQRERTVEGRLGYCQMEFVDRVMRKGGRKENGAARDRSRINE
jgi:hypothetical protein